jgi:PAS domain S-box-containing protein
MGMTGSVAEGVLMTERPTDKALEQGGQALEREAAERSRAGEPVHPLAGDWHVLLNNLNDGIFVMDDRGRFVFVNQVIEKRSGRSLQWFKGMHFLDVVSPKDRERAGMNFDRALSGEEVPPFEVQYMTSDGRRLTVEVNTTSIYEEGRVIGLWGVSHDVTERRRIYESLLQSQSNYRTLLEHLPQKIFFKNTDSIYVICNESYARDLQIEPEAIAGKTDFEFFPRELAEKYRADDARIMTACETEVIEEKYIRHGQEAIIQTVKTPVRDKDGTVTGVLGIFWDITEKKQAEQALRDSEAELKRRHHELEAVNGILVRVTKEYDLNGIASVLEDTAEAFYSGADVLLFLLSPERDSFYFPSGGAGQSKETCYDRARKKIRDHGIERDLLTVLTTEPVKPSCTGKTVDCPAVIQLLAAGYPAWMAVPIEVERVCHGLFIVGLASAEIRGEEELVFVESLIGQISGVIRNHIAKEAREEAFRRQLTGPDKFMGLVGQSKPMQEIYRLISAVADSESTVLITGESGTGKELVARAIHQAGKYKHTPFIAAHCSSFVPTLVHSELFGHEKGAFTGASSRQLGRLERAQGGILFLDEIADLPLETQVLLLRFLQDRSFERVGGQRPIQVNARIIAATNRQIEKDVKAGRLREDFYYRLNVVRIRVPPLRERISDVPQLANHFLRSYCLIEGKAISGFDSQAMRFMMDYDWPGNVRELQNVVARCVVLSTGGSIQAEDFVQTMRPSYREPAEYALAQNERVLILKVLEKCNWNKHEASRLLNISRGTLYSKLKKYNIQKQGPG